MSSQCTAGHDSKGGAYVLRTQGQGDDRTGIFSTRKETLFMYSIFLIDHPAFLEDGEISLRHPTVETEVSVLPPINATYLLLLQQRLLL